MAKAHALHLSPDIRREILKSWASLWIERLTHALWPIATVVVFGLVLWGIGLFAQFSSTALWLSYLIFCAACAFALLMARDFRIPSWQEAALRLDLTDQDRPIQSLIDSQNSSNNPLWHIHILNMQRKAEGLRAFAPRIETRSQDPYALRLFALLCLSLTLLFGGVWRGADLSSGVGVNTAEALMAGPSWEGWIDPPRYTGRPSLYLPDVPTGSLAVPEGSRLILRAYGEEGAIRFDHTLGAEISEQAHLLDFVLQNSGPLTVVSPQGFQTWDIVLMPDAAPRIMPQAPKAAPLPATLGTFLLPYTAQDDFGVAQATAMLTLDNSRINKRHGLYVPPENIAPLELTLPLPVSGNRTDFEAALQGSVEKHVLANLPVVLVLQAQDDAGQKGVSEPMQTIFPGRSFFDARANALVELRRDLLWSRENAKRTAQLLRALTYQNRAGLPDHKTHLKLRRIIRQLEGDIALTHIRRDTLAEDLWQIALTIEEQNLEGALARLRQAQSRLAEAIRQGASPEEIERLTQELRRAMDDYLRQKAQQQPQSNEGADQSDEEQEGQEGQEITKDQLDELMDRIQELTEEGRTAEAQRLLQELEELLQNLEVQQQQGQGEGDPQQGQGQEAMENLQDQLREQQGLSDEAFRSLQEQFNPNAQVGESQGNVGRNGGAGQGETHEEQGAQGEGSQGQAAEPTGSLADRQRALSERLENLGETMPSTQSGDAERALNRAQRAMNDAAHAIEENRLADAIDSQAQAMTDLRESMSELAQAMNEQAGEGQGSQEGGQRQDPLGRETGEGGASDRASGLDGRSERERARDLRDEIRRRSSETERAEQEKDYLNRLLERF